MQEEIRTWYVDAYGIYTNIYGNDPRLVRVIGTFKQALDVALTQNKYAMGRLQESREMLETLKEEYGRED